MAATGTKRGRRGLVLVADDSISLDEETGGAGGGKMDAPSPKVVAGRWGLILVGGDAADGLGGDVAIDRIEIGETIVNPTIDILLLEV